MHEAAQKGRATTLKDLLSRPKADPCAVDEVTPYLLALMENSPAITEVIVLVMACLTVCRWEIQHCMRPPSVVS